MATVTAGLPSSGTISASQINTELGRILLPGRSSTANFDINAVDPRWLADKVGDGVAISFSNFYGKHYFEITSDSSTADEGGTTAAPTTTTTTTTTTTAAPGTTTNISGFMSVADPYAAKSGFSLDSISGSIWLTAGMYPASYAGSSWHANDGVAWELLKFKGTGTNQLSNDNTSNVYQLTNNLYDRWGMMDSVNISAISIGSSANLNHSTYSISVYGAGWPFNVTVKPTYVVRRTGTNTATIELGADDPVTDYNISDTGNAITIRNWFARTNLLFGGTNEETGLDAYGNPIITVPFSRGVRTLTW